MKRLHQKQEFASIAYNVIGDGMIEHMDFCRNYALKYQKTYDNGRKILNQLVSSKFVIQTSDNRFCVNRNEVNVMNDIPGTENQNLDKENLDLVKKYKLIKIAKNIIGNGSMRYKDFCNEYSTKYQRSYENGRKILTCLRSHNLVMKTGNRYIIDDDETDAVMSRLLNNKLIRKTKGEDYVLNLDEVRVLRNRSKTAPIYDTAPTPMFIGFDFDSSTNRIVAIFTMPADDLFDELLGDTNYRFQKFDTGITTPQSCWLQGHQVVSNADVSSQLKNNLLKYFTSECLRYLMSFQKKITSVAKNPKDAADFSRLLLFQIATLQNNINNLNLTKFNDMTDNDNNTYVESRSTSANYENSQTKIINIVDEGTPSITEFLLQQFPNHPIAHMQN